MAENDFVAQYQPYRNVTFLGFDSDYHPHLYGDMVITLHFTTRNRRNSKVLSFDSEGPSYSTKAPPQIHF
jgi:hypothetical protein